MLSTIVRYFLVPHIRLLSLQKSFPSLEWIFLDWTRTFRHWFSSCPAVHRWVHVLLYLFTSPIWRVLTPFPFSDLTSVHDGAADLWLYSVVICWTAIIFNSSNGLKRMFWPSFTTACFSFTSAGVCGIPILQLWMIVWVITPYNSPITTFSEQIPCVFLDVCFLSYGLSSDSFQYWALSPVDIFSSSQILYLFFKL